MRGFALQYQEVSISAAWHYRRRAALALRRKAKTTPVHSLTLRESLRHSPTSWPRVTNIANATGLTCCLLLTFQLCTPYAVIAGRCGLIGGAPENHQRDRDCEPSSENSCSIIPHSLYG
jgi:hypothetical protein